MTREAGVHAARARGRRRRGGERPALPAAGRPPCRCRWYARRSWTPRASGRRSSPAWDRRVVLAARDRGHRATATPGSSRDPATTRHTAAGGSLSSAPRPGPCSEVSDCSGQLRRHPYGRCRPGGTDQARRATPRCSDGLGRSGHPTVVRRTGPVGPPHGGRRDQVGRATPRWSDGLGRSGHPTVVELVETTLAAWSQGPTTLRVASLFRS